MATRKTPPKIISKAGKKLSEIAPKAGSKPPAAKPPDAGQIDEVLRTLGVQRTGTRVAAPAVPILMTGVPEDVAQAVATVSPDGISAAMALRIATLTPAAAVVIGVPPDRARALAAASPPGILTRETFETLVKISPPVQALTGISPRTALLLATVSPEGLTAQTIEALRGVEPAARNLRPSRGTGG